MDIIIVSDKHSQSRSMHLGTGFFLFCAVLCLGLLAGAVGAGFYASSAVSEPGAGREEVHAWQQALEEQKQQVLDAREQADREVEALTVRIGELQARLLRLDALGERLARMADLDPEEFDFGAVPAQGGPEVLIAGDEMEPVGFVQMLDQLALDIDHRGQQLQAISKMMGRRELLKDVFVTGVPVDKGWVSSRYGRRTDPIRGNIGWHQGFDFAGKMGTDIVSVAAGVVTYSGKRSGYGRLVEVNHGNGYSTRYAHNQKNLVKVGDIIEKGQVIAKMGSSGRSTGPHVHFEVHRNGKPVNPAGYISRASQ